MKRPKQALNQNQTVIRSQSKLPDCSPCYVTGTGFVLQRTSVAVDREGLFSDASTCTYKTKDEKRKRTRSHNGAESVAEAVSEAAHTWLCAISAPAATLDSSSMSSPQLQITFFCNCEMLYCKYFPNYPNSSISLCKSCTGSVFLRLLLFLF